VKHLLDEEPVAMAALFFGLVLASVAVAWEELRQRDPLRLSVLAATAVVTFLVLGLRSNDDVTVPLIVMLGAGALAACAMILPGISGSFILLMLGLYHTVLDAVNDRDIAVLAAFMAGVVLGLASFSSLLGWLLRRHRDLAMAALIGLMLGSLRVLWPWPDGTETAALSLPAAGDLPVPLLLAIVGAAVVYGLARLSRAAIREGA
jgi:putative membrane protein